MEQIKIYRKEHGIRQVDFAQSLGIGQSYLSKIESGILNPDILLAFKIEDVTDGVIRARAWAELASEVSK